MPHEASISVSAGSLRLFRVAGISVWVHWSWLLIAYLELQFRANYYQSPVWNVVEYVTLFAIVLLHEFGHVLACRQVGGQANEIVLWPLGGIAFVSPPPRPGAVLWSIAAGPLVNVALVPLTFGAVVLSGLLRWDEINFDLHRYLVVVFILNLMLLAFNMLPIYPLDGGQILQALLWFWIGRARSLLVVSVVGMVAGAAALVLAIVIRDWWIAILAAFVALRSWAGFQQARMMAQVLGASRRADAACPACGFEPPVGPFWLCSHCQQRFDTFSHQATCPGCGRQFPVTSCPRCGQAQPIAAWYDRATAAPVDGEQDGA